MTDLPFSPPDRTLAQRRAALAKANKSRSARAKLKKQMAQTDKAAAVDVALRIVRRPAPVFESMRVYDLLLALPSVGRVRVVKFLDQIQCSPSKTVAGISPRQRRALIAALEHYQAHVISTHPELQRAA